MVYYGCNFNVSFGYLEAICRGFKLAILSRRHYMILQQCQTLADMRLMLQSTNYGNFLSNETTLSVPIIEMKIRQKFIDEFVYIRNNATKPLSTFLDFITHGYMIDNIVLLITGMLHERPIAELLTKCHPLGSFDQMGAIHVVNNPEQLYNAILIDSPLAPYFEECLSLQDLSAINVEIIRNKLYKTYLEAFYRHCRELGGLTAEIMCNILEFEADRRAIFVTINSFGTELTKEERSRLYPSFGKMYPSGFQALAEADDFDQVRFIVECYHEYAYLFENEHEHTLEDQFFMYEIKLHLNSFMRQFHFGIFYSFLRLKEQECRNIVWISECLVQNYRDKSNNYINMKED